MPNGGETPHWVRFAPVDLFTWNTAIRDFPEAEPRFLNNFGDLIGPVLIGRLLPRKAPTATVHRELFSVGSVLHFAHAGAVVWGSGINFKVPSPVPETAASLDIRSVRGRLTAAALRAAGARVPELFGDPALLLPDLAPDLVSRVATPDLGVLCVPNFNDFEPMEIEAVRLGASVADPRWPLHWVLDAIGRAEFVIGSSLHAVIIADAMGIPARFVASGTEHPLKYHDYLSGTGRPVERVADSVSEALTMGAHRPAEYDKDALLRAFPLDLWLPDRRSPLQPEAVVDPLIERAWRGMLTAAGVSPHQARADFVGTILPETVQATDIASTSHDGSFAAALRFRHLVVPDLTVADIPHVLRPALEGLDHGTPATFRLALQLGSTPPHAIARQTRRSGTHLVLSVGLRPGGLSNSITSLTMRLESESSGSVSVRLPVFAVYRSQWSLDLTAAFDIADLVDQPLSATIIVGDGTVGPVEIPVLLPDGHDQFPRVAELSRWSSEPEQSPGNVEAIA